MEFKVSSVKSEKRRSLKIANLAPEELASKYPFTVQFYDLPPTENVTLQEFTEFAIERLKVLRVIERTKLKFKVPNAEYRDALCNELRKENLMGYCRKTLEKAEEFDESAYCERRRDHISHFILRLVYCKTEDLRRWFIKQEVDLFLFRFALETPQTVSKFLEFMNMKIDPISEEEKVRLAEPLRIVQRIADGITKESEHFKVPFTDILDLVQRRRVYLENGYGFLRLQSISSLVASRFREHLSHSLAMTSRALPSMSGDPRLMPILNGLHNRYVGEDYSSKAIDGQITRDMINSLSEHSFPLCMQQLHEAFRQNHHLRHEGRRQYSLFLKGIGLSLEEILIMWKEEFTKIMDGDKFDRQYSYGLRYVYGKEGKRINQTPFSCIKLISYLAPGVGEFHGCPFKHTDRTHLKNKLSAYKISPDGVNEVLELVSGNHYQIACTRCFELHHNSTLKQGINHPNQYFDESRKMASDAPLANKELEMKHERPKRISQLLPSSSSLESSETPLISQSSESFDIFPDDMDELMTSMEES